MKLSHLVLAVILALGLTFALLCTLQDSPGSALAETGLAPTPPSLTRQHDAVVITGGLLPDLTGSSLDEIFVYAYRDTTPTQIPFQIDERGEGGMYVPVEDGQLDDNDELVFMAADGGARVGLPWLNAGEMSISPTYVITLTDPISDTYAWVYVFRSAALSRTFTADYVSYDEGDDRVTSSGWYALGFNGTYGFVDFLALRDGSPDLVDRRKFRVTGTLDTMPFLLDEEDITQDDVHVIDGPVRVTRVSAITLSIGPGVSAQGTYTLFAYRSLAVQQIPLSVPGAPFQIGHLRTSMDWSEQASGMTYYDANNPTGTTIDGIPDVITVTPATRWTQVTGITGTVVNVSEIPAGLGGAQSTYYMDDGTLDAGDTGDQRAYGDAGLQVYDPIPGTYDMLEHMYFVTGTMTDAGTTCVDWYDHPLQVDIAVMPPTWLIHLPLVMKN